MGHVASLLSQVLGEGEKALIGYVFTPRNQMNLVVTVHNLPVLAHKQRGVIHIEAGAMRVQRSGTRDHRRVHGERQSAQTGKQARVFVEKRRRGFRPQDDSGRDGHYWAIGGNGIGVEFGHTGEVGPTSPSAELDELAHVLVVLGAGPTVVLIDV